MTVDTESELEALRLIGRMVANVLEEMLSMAEPGMTTLELDAIGAARLNAYGARSAPQLAVGFPGVTCISVNEEIAHGIPGARVLCEGDILNVDVSAELDGFFADNGATRVIGPPDEKKQRLIEVTRQARDKAIDAMRPGVSLNRVGRIFEGVARKTGYCIIKNLCSHGVGRALHEEPTEILGYYNRMDRRRFTLGSVFTLEPFMSTSSCWAKEAEDGWTLVNDPGGRSAQFEHTIVLHAGEAEVLTLPGAL